jgi:hypothetical protein
VVQAGGMPNLPTPIRAALGLAATAVDEARKLPETLPQAVTTVPMMAISTAMQTSLRVQQHIAMLAARGDEVLSRLRGSSAEPPSWATFDDPATEPAADDNDNQPLAAFDRIDYDNTGFAEGGEAGDADEGKGRWDAVGVGGSEPAATGIGAFPGDASSDLQNASPELSAEAIVAIGILDEAITEAAAEDDSAAAADLATTADRLAAADIAGFAYDAAELRAPAADLDRPDAAEADSSSPLVRPRKSRPRKAVKAVPAEPAKAAAEKAVPTKAAGAAPEKAVPTKAAGAAPEKAVPTKAAKAAPVKAKAAPVKAAKGAGRRAKSAPRDHEPLERAARKAKPSAVPNPATMAAEIVQAHEAATDE